MEVSKIAFITLCPYNHYICICSLDWSLEWPFLIMCCLASVHLLGHLRMSIQTNWPYFQSKPVRIWVCGYTILNGYILAIWYANKLWSVSLSGRITFAVRACLKWLILRTQSFITCQPAQTEFNRSVSPLCENIDINYEAVI